MKNIVKAITYLAIFALILTTAAFGHVVHATDGNPLLATVPDTGQALNEEDDTEVFFEDVGVYDDVNAAAAPGEVSMHDWSNTADALFMHWEKAGYPDDIGGVYYDSESGMMGFLLVSPTQERIDELRALFTDDVVFTPSAYSYNELRLAQEEINAIMGAGSGIYSTGVGWTSTDRRVHGFGESGKEFRLVVGVDESVFGHYSEGFAALYGDRVVVEIGGPLVEDSMAIITGDGSGLDGGMAEGGAGTGASGSIAPIVPVDISVALVGSAFYVSANNAPFNGLWLWAVIAIGLAGTLLLLLRLKSRPVPAMQTANGGIVAGSSVASKKQVVDAVRKSAISPSEELFDRVSKRIDSQENV